MEHDLQKVAVSL